MTQLNSIQFFLAHSFTTIGHKMLEAKYSLLDLMGFTNKWEKCDSKQKNLM